MRRMPEREWVHFSSLIPDSPGLSSSDRTGAAQAFRAGSVRDDEDRGSKWLLTHHGDIILRLGGVHGFRAWRAAPAEVVQPLLAPTSMRPDVSARAGNIVSRAAV